MTRTITTSPRPEEQDLDGGHGAFRLRGRRHVAPARQRIAGDRRPRLRPGSEVARPFC
jgi:hypothetical protein